ncbi:MAG: DEAD/DEAH box helicase [Desulfobacteraceae bacterium]|nr:MAG: DEAD/DEAH box helicase [Desulfobacteraceae bacterium]
MLTLNSVPGPLAAQIRQRLTMQNPAWIDAQRMGRWTGSIPRNLRFYREEAGCLILPRGFTRELISICRGQNVQYELIDRRRTLPEVSFTFSGTLKPFQAQAVKDVLGRDFGILEAPTGSGKTVMALAIVAARRQSTLITVHTRELLEQWIQRIETFLGIPRDQIGIVGNGKRTVGDRITVALVQSLYKCAAEVAQRIGFLVLDECHRAPSRTFTEAVSAFDCRYMLGLSATPWRRDGLSRLIFWYLGDVVHQVERKTLEESGDILRAEVVSRETSFRTDLDASEEYSRVISDLTQDSARNKLIASDVAKEAFTRGGTCLVLSDRKEHCRTLQALLLERGIRADLLTGELSNRARADVVERLNSGRIKVLCATGQLVGEGFDCRELDTLFVTTPIRFNGRVLQYLGRVLRPAPGKALARVYDYCDSQVGVLKASARARRKIYGC